MQSVKYGEPSIHTTAALGGNTSECCTISERVERYVDLANGIVSTVCVMVHHSSDEKKYNCDYIAMIVKLKIS